MATMWTRPTSLLALPHPRVSPAWTTKLEGQSSRLHVRLFVYGKLVMDNWARQRPESFFNSSLQEEKGKIAVKAGMKHNILVEFCNVRAPADGDEDETVQDSNPGVHLDGAEVQAPNVKMATKDGCPSWLNG
ncbi:hypothetical protein OG21DRAFT_1521776 [Imleria badia]|nr:hypothetical protein OG21DRAFT_1521776 [Imleria badia]